MKIHLSVELPEELHYVFLQSLRDFDSQHDPNHEGIIKITTLSTGQFTAEEFVSNVRGIRPSLPVTMKKEFDS